MHWAWAVAQKPFDDAAAPPIIYFLQVDFKSPASHIFISQSYSFMWLAPFSISQWRIQDEQRRRQCKHGGARLTTLSSGNVSRLMKSWKQQIYCFQIAYWTQLHPVRFVTNCISVHRLSLLRFGVSHVQTILSGESLVLVLRVVHSEYSPHSRRRAASEIFLVASQLSSDWFL